MLVKEIILKRIFGPKIYEVTGQRRKLHSEKVHNLYSSPSMIRQTKSRRMRLAGHGARMGGMYTGFRRETPKESDRSENRGVNGECDQNGSYGDSAWGGGGVDPVGSG
jgi:hypothetical protein